MRVRICGDNATIDECTAENIREQYPLEEELKLMRKAIDALDRGEPVPEDYKRYTKYVQGLVTKRKALKS